MALVCAGAGLPSADAQCTGISFLTGPALFPSRSSNGIALKQEADGSYSQLEASIFAPYSIVSKVPNIQQILANCVPIPVYTGPPQTVPQAGLPSQIGVGAYFAGGSMGLAAYSRYNVPRLHVLVGDIGAQQIISDTVYPAGVVPQSFLLADLNRDGNVDLIAVDNGKTGTNASSGGLYIFIGNGDGTFQAGVLATVRDHPYSVTSADFNGDGIPDLATANQGTADVSILLGNGDGTFQAPIQNAVSAGNTSVLGISAADMDGDGLIDIVATDSRSSVWVLPGNGDGTLRAGTAFPAGNVPVYAAVADFNSDGIPDIVVTNSRDNAVSVLMGLGKGQYAAPSGYVVNYLPTAVVIADINQDGALDLVVGGGNASGIGGNPVTVLFGNGDGTFQGASLYRNGIGNNGLNNSGDQLMLGDFNGDGIPDAMVTGNLATSFGILPGKAGGGFGPAITIATRDNNGNGPQVSTSAVADLNGDNMLDILVGGLTFNGGGVSYFQGNGDGTFQTPVITKIGAGKVTALATSDFNADGIPDLVVSYNLNTSDATAGLVFLPGLGGGKFGDPAMLPVSGTPMVLKAADVNGDGKMDLILVDFGNFGSSTVPGGVAIYLGNGDGSFTPPLLYAAGINPKHVTMADVTADGIPDLVLSAAGPNFQYNIVILPGNGDGTYGAPAMIRTDFGPEEIVAGDFDGDGNIDLIVAHCCGSTDMTYLLGNGNGTFQPEKHFNAGPSPSAVAVADLNGDGKPDLVVSGVGVAVLLNTSNPPAGAAPQFKRKPRN